MTTYITIKSLPDSLVKVFEEDTDEILFIDTTNEDGETEPIAISGSNHKYYIDVTPYPGLRLITNS